MSDAQSGQIDTVMQEDRLFPPSAEFAAAAHIGSMEAYQKLWDEAEADTEAFWDKLAQEELHWFKPYDKVLEWEAPFAKWFVGGKTNVSYNCLDAHLDSPRKNKAAIIWEGEPGDQRTLTYQELHREVCKFANVLKGLGVNEGDVVSIYMGMTPELAIACLACARIGAVHSVIFGGFSAEAIADRNNDASAKLQITADGGWRRGSQLPLKETVDAALEKSPTVEKCVVLRRTDADVNMVEGRDFWWDELMEDASADCPATELDSEAPLFILYTSGSTGKPKGIKHTTAGYNLYTKMTSRWVFDLKEDDVYWCTADVGWITGHSYIIYGPLINGTTVLMYEGAPNHPYPNRWWQMIENHGVTILYTSPTAIRGLMRFGEAWPNRHDLSSLRLLGSVGEPINPEAWRWYYRVIGKERCPIMDTWWQTETGGFMITPLPITPLKPGSATKPFFGNEVAVVDDDGNEVPTGDEGKLVLKAPWPGMARTIYREQDRFREVYWQDYEKQGWYKTGDSARIDRDGYIWIIGRIDDVIKVSGYRLGTAEIESALVSHPDVAEAAAIALPHEIKGNGIHAYVILKSGVKGSGALEQALIEHVAREIGPIARPEEVSFVDSLPKTRSGKIMRRVLKARALGMEEGDLTTLEE